MISEDSQQPHSAESVALARENLTIKRWDTPTSRITTCDPAITKSISAGIAATHAVSVQLKKEDL